MTATATTPRRGLLTRPEQLRHVMDVPFSPEQLTAACAPLEPGVVVAGAGSGKTTVMAARVVWLVGSGQVRPEQVLGLTFTNKAAGELAHRVRGALAALTAHGGSTARRSSSVSDTDVSDTDVRDTDVRDTDVRDTDEAVEPTISTYHAFAGRLVQEHGLRLGVEPRARLLADATRYQLAARVVRAAKGPFTALSATVPTLVTQVVSLDAELREHLVALDDLRAHDRALVAEIDALPKATGPLRALADAARRRLELATLVASYREAKDQRDLVDFGDQVALAATLAEECPAVAATERTRFRVVLLDEYQDTSVAQRRMLSGLFGQGHPVTAVGDPCQAIYGWRGASVANLDDFPKHFPRRDGSPAQRYSLTENRRSGSRLLDLANTVAARLRVLHGVDPLRACAAKQQQGETVCALFPTYDEEVHWVAAQVEEAIAGGIAAGEIAVLVRARSDFAALHGALSERGVPVEVVGLGGLLALPEVADLVATLEVLDDPMNNAALVRLLAGPRWRVGPRDLVLLGRRARDLVRAGITAPGEASLDDGPPSDALDDKLDDDLDRALEDAVAGVDPTEVVALADAIDRPGAAVPYSAEARHRFALLAAELRDLRPHLGEPLLDLLHRIVTTTGLDVELGASPQALAARRRENLAAFLDTAASFVDLEGDVSVTAFLAYLRAADEFERGLDTTAPSGSAAVKLLTAHKAKGLEWDVVVVPMLSRNVFPGGRVRERWTSNPHVLPHPLRGDFDSGLPALTDLTSKGLKEFDAAAKEHAALEERRLGYVAFTRARRRLVASGHHWGPTQKRPRGPSEFLEEVRTHCEAGHGVVSAWAPMPADDETNPALEAARIHAWPPPYQPAAFAARQEAARAVREQLAHVGAAGPHDPGDAAGTADRPREATGAASLTAAEREIVDGWDRDLPVLLDELSRARSAVREVALPPAISATQVLRLASDPTGLARALARPMPRRPQPAARRGTQFHAWVEAQFAQQPLLEPDDLPGSADADIRDDRDLQALREAFARSPYAARAPHRVEAAFQLVLGTRVVRGRIDAVYDLGNGRFEVVDWKTNREETADPLQLALYRLAWAELAGVGVDDVDAAFLYVRTGAVVRPANLPGRAELERLLGHTSTSTANAQ